MTPFRAAATRVRRALAASALVTALAAVALVAPAAVSTRLAEPARAAVYSSCTLSRCADARTARSGWSAKSFPTSRGWYSWSGGTCNFAGGQFYNREGQLPANATYYEYDVYPRACNASRDAYRIVVNKSTGTTWFSPDHYANFYRL
ncbi:ribonuclease domain-containing protein [Micromonospora sp. WMMD975]|uniref:ribonuclease domain-containing protein n=1 Tax=Micromonospora sp. WMMD975 TaxID=3016087 RepID=UPI00249BCA86|nr:ribonuclease domain-containing protein [Micromonospora sp. WMMD975]WFE36001.1 ribonuclease domain-containing protein [Micromonospora sp. WMMD975]